MRSTKLARLARLIGLEFILKGGFFISGILLYKFDRTEFSVFTYTNANFTLAYNVIALGLPFLTAKALHDSRPESFGGLRTLWILSFLMTLIGCLFFNEFLLLIMSAFCMTLMDTIYSTFRIRGSTSLYRYLTISGAIIFVFNIMSFTFADSEFRYYGIIISLFAAIPLLLGASFIQHQQLRISWKSVSSVSLFSVLRERKVWDGISFSCTHVFFWIRNGLDKIILFPIISSDSYARYGLAFFFIAGAQAIWTSLMRVFQRQVFSFVSIRFRSATVFQFVSCLVGLVTILVFHYASFDYTFIIFVGAINHFCNQLYVTLLNYHFPIYLYSVINLIVSTFYLVFIWKFPIDLDTLAILFSASNLLLGFVYTVVARVGFARRGML